MLNAFGSPAPPPPPRLGSVPVAISSKQQQQPNNDALHKESIGAFFVFLLILAMLFSTFSLLYYAQRDKAVYEEIVDYLDKTISISKINYNPVLNLYELHQDEIDSLGEQRRYKTLIWTFLFSDIGCFVFLGIALFLYYNGDILGAKSIRVLFWVFLVMGTVYALVEVCLFTTLIFPYSATLPNATEAMLDHAVPHNPGGLMQMEHRLDCIFNQNLYQAYKRRQSEGNTCDPYILSSFIPRFLMITFGLLRLLAIFIFTGLIIGGQSNPIGWIIAQLVQRTRPSSSSSSNSGGNGGAANYKNRYAKNPNATKGAAADNIHTPKAITTFGVKEAVNNRAPITTPPLGQLDHSISYNNAAFFAISGAHHPTALGINTNIMNYPLGSSDTSHNGDMPDQIFNRSTHTTNSIVSDV